MKIGLPGLDEAYLEIATFAKERHGWIWQLLFSADRSVFVGVVERAARGDKIMRGLGLKEGKLSPDGKISTMDNAWSQAIRVRLRVFACVRDLEELTV